ncbi:hypothetical protein AB0B89_29225 [Sphaerisporangium sp. NPDC049002]|uniref:hypothetical protein n=1 Tax=Sphaerisporangium sp. NPDC049002 TaxID=3155392 RepID=UPI0033EE1F53
MTAFITLLAVVALAVCSMREDVPTARTPSRVWADLRAAGWKRVAWLLVCALVGGAAIALYAATRTGMYGALLALAALACRGASAAAMDDRPVRVCRLEIAR